MLHRSIPERAIGALLGGDLVTAVLHRHLIGLVQSGSPQPKMTELLRDLAAAIQRDIDHRTGSALRFNETAPFVDNLCDNGLLNSVHIPQLDAAFDAVLDFGSAGDVHFRDIQVQHYAQTLAELDPTVLVAWRLVRWTETKGNEQQGSLKTVVGGLGTLFVPRRFDPHPFADNHTHLSGVTGNELVLTQIVLGQPRPGAQLEHKDALQRIRRIRRILESLTGLWSANNDVDRKRIDTWAKNVLSAIPDIGKAPTPDAHIDWGMLAKGIVATGNDQSPIDSKWLLRMLADSASQARFEDAWVWLFIALWRTYRHENIRPTARVIILYVIADIMVLRRQLTMEGSGLRRFTRQYFASTLRDVAKNRIDWATFASRDAVRRLFARPGDKAAIKVGMETLGQDWLSALACDANAVIGAHENDPDLDYRRSGGYWHLCAHFNRVTEEQSRDKLWKMAVGLRDSLYSDTPRPLTKRARDGTETEFKLFPSELIRGLDVVGDETRWPIERFAPMLRWLRSPAAAPKCPLGFPPGLAPERAAPRLQFSIHAGEDYAHPLSGLRHVAETVEFCGMEPGDRLGHALALGIPPDEWLQRHGDVMLPLDEHVDNLVWAWYEAKQLGGLAEAQSVLPRLQARIARLLPHVSWYPAAGAPTPLTGQHLQHLYDAWAMRKNCPYKALEEPGDPTIDADTLGIAAPDWPAILAARHSATTATAAGLYVLRANHNKGSPTAEKKPTWQVRVAVQRHGHVTRRQLELEKLDADALAAALAQPIPCLHDHDDAADLTLMHVLQDACIERYAVKGLSIETNPSSNVYIGQLQTHCDHPIYRWDPPDAADLANGKRFNLFGLRFRPIAVTINTDDPGMIPTTLRMEHHLMHEGAIDRGYTAQQADAWIEKLRKLGLAVFEAMPAPV